jgi:hypothetical protein
MEKLKEQYSAKKKELTFLQYYWNNTKWLIGFSALAQILFFILILGVDKSPFWFWICTWFVLAINLIRFFGLLFKFRKR